MPTVYEALYESIVQYDLIVWGRCTENAITLFIVQQDLAVRCCKNAWIKNKYIIKLQNFKSAASYS